MNGGVQLVLPGLFDLLLEELEADFLSAALPGLNRILGYATPRPNADYSIDAMLRGALALAPASSGLPMARAFAGGAGEAGRELLVEPIHLRAGLHNAIAMPIPPEPGSREDIDILINDLNDTFKVNFDITAVAGGAFLLCLKGFDAPTHYPHPLSVLGKSINPFIEQARQVLPWYQLLNEVQMFLHQHGVNERRQREGRLPINSLWAWGAGVLPELDSPPTWYCDDPVLNRFADALGMPTASCAQLADGGRLQPAVIVDLRLMQLLKAGHDARLDRLLLDIEQTLLAPLLRALAKYPAPLHLRAGYRLDFELTPSARFKFWRRPGSLADWHE